MDDEMSMCEIHGVAHVLDQLEAAIDRQRLSLAVLIDRLAVDQLHGEVRDSLARDAAIDQTSDARMLEQRQNASFREKAADDAGRAVLDQLERDPLVELPVGALAEEHASHPAAPDLAYDSEGSDSVGYRSADGGRRFEQRRGDPGGWRFENAAVAMIRAHELEHLVTQVLVPAARAIDEGRALSGGNVDGGVEEGIDALESVGG